MSIDQMEEGIIQWLKPASVTANYELARSQCHLDTGKWFLESQEFRTWKQDEHQMLWLHGIRECTLFRFSAVF